MTREERLARPRVDLIVMNTARAGDLAGAYRLAQTMGHQGGHSARLLCAMASHAYRTAYAEDTMLAPYYPGFGLRYQRRVARGYVEPAVRN